MSMRRRSSFLLLKFLLFLLNRPSLAQRPNILLITTDDMTFDSLGAYGCPVENITPHIDKLATEGIIFDYGFVNIAICTPSRHVILSGSHSHETMTRGFTFIERVGPAMPDVLKGNGYFTAQVNKRVGRYNWDKNIAESDDFGRNVTRQGEILDNLIEIAQAQDKPWFVMLNFNDPHRAFYGARHPAEERRGPFSSIPSHVYTSDEIEVPGFLPEWIPDIRLDVAQYYSSVKRADDGVGVLMQVLENRGLSNGTIVVFMADNGMSQPFAKINCYQAGLRVPFILRYPGRIVAGTRDTSNMVSAVDLAPTLLEMVDLPVPVTMSGRSFVPLLQEQSQGGRDYVIGYYYRNLRSTQLYPEFAVHMVDWLYIYNPWVNGRTEVHNSDYTKSPTLLSMWLVARTNESVRERVDFHKYRIREELYHLEVDPHSFDNLAARPENRPRVVAMQALIVKWMEETDHPALDLMKDPYNQDLIEKYMAFEVANAQEQLSSSVRGIHNSCLLILLLWSALSTDMSMP